MDKINDYPQLIQNLIKELKKTYLIGEFYSERFYEADDIKIAEILFNTYNESKICSCNPCKCKG